MNHIFETLLLTIRAKGIGFWTTARLLFNPTYWRVTLFSKLRIFFTSLWNVKPRDRLDYYTVYKWMVSKRLAFAIVIVIGIACGYFILMMQPVYGVSGNDAIHAYDYDSIPLKYKSGVVKILAKDKHVAYVGNVIEGFCEGEGKLYDADNNLIYEGAFANSMFNGQGKLFYPSGSLKFDGTFVDNEFSGAGRHYAPSGTMSYEGSFLHGKEGGLGTKFNSAGNPILKGNFVFGGFAFAELLGKTTEQAAQMYMGKTQVYSIDAEYCVAMVEAGAVYAVEPAVQKLEDTLVIDRIFVEDSAVYLNGQELNNINDLTKSLGEPYYYGSTWITLPEAVLFYNSAEKEAVEKPKLNLTETFQDVFTVVGYDKNQEVYIYVYPFEGLLYTFYCVSAEESGFLAYAISLVK